MVLPCGFFVETNGPGFRPGLFGTDFWIALSQYTDRNQHKTNPEAS